MQQDSGDTTVAALVHISQQLEALRNSSNAAPGSLSAFGVPTFHPQGSAIRINTLWFTSLVLSLISASLGILVKQWLREYLNGDFASPWEQIRVRHHRYQNLRSWNVFEIAAIPQILLQLSLILFLLGLSEFLRQLNAVVGGVAAALIFVWLLLFTLSVIAPIISSRCPYNFLLSDAVSGTAQNILTFRAQAGAKREYEEKIRRNPEGDITILINADEHLSNDRVLNTIIYPCLRNLPRNIPNVLHFTKKTLQHRLPPPFSLEAPLTFTNVQNLDFDRLTKTALSTLTNIAFDLLSFQHEQLPDYWEEPELQSVRFGYLRETLVLLMAIASHSSKQIRNDFQGATRRAIGLVETLNRLTTSRRPEVVEECIGCMSCSSDIPIGNVGIGGEDGRHIYIDSYFPHLTISHSDLGHIIEAAHKLIDTQKVPILGLCRVVLSLLTADLDRISTTSIVEQQSIHHLLSSMAPQLVTLSPDEHHTRAEKCYDLCISLYSRFPKLVSKTLMVNLHYLSSQSVHPL